MFRLYTKTGDDGTTGLFGGPRVSKDDARVQAYGAADETNAALGLAAAACDDTDARLAEILASLQSRLFDLGSDLATPTGTEHESKIRRLTVDDVTQAESWIDEIDGDNAELKQFILPGGCDLAARLHLARNAARRCEQAMVTLSKGDSVNEHAMHWINRLSDLLFAMARAANRLHGVEDVPWRGA
ncbi:MAG: ATP:cob(I)alamin adenosyltransferase [Phycisphaerae bacterium]|nr:ATP:cob(I)alamin adenosyltransferase [Phycisphaerae bacterium]